MDPVMKHKDHLRTQFLIIYRHYADPISVVFDEIRTKTRSIALYLRAQSSKAGNLGKPPNQKISQKVEKVHHFFDPHPPPGCFGLF